MHLWAYSSEHVSHAGPSHLCLVNTYILIFKKIFWICKLYKTLKNTLHKQVSDKTYMTKLLENHESVILPANLQAAADDQKTE